MDMQSDKFFNGVALPSTDELPCSDDTPVDNEEHNLIPNVLLFLLQYIWKHRRDWYFGVEMAVYHTTGSDFTVPVVPDAFLSLGVERKKGGKSRNSYATWEENWVAPILTLELVSHIPRGEYDEKLNIYAKLGVLYYVIYNPEFWERDQHQPFEVYKLIDNSYQLQVGEPCWMPEIKLGIGRYISVSGGGAITEELIGLYDEEGNRHLTPEEFVAEQRKQRGEEEIYVPQVEPEWFRYYQQAEQERQRVERLSNYLRSLGIDPDNLLD